MVAGSDENGESSIRFVAEYEEGIWRVMPYVGDVPLADLVARYEARNGYDVVGGYDGAFLDRLDHATRFLGRRGPWPATLSLLECECGTPGCWPLEARVRREDGRIIWDRFYQPHRPHRDYSSFGPFAFDEGQYRRALGRAVGGNGSQRI